MARGRPAAWSALFGVPLVVVGTYVYALQSRYPLVANQPEPPSTAGLPLVVFGAFVVALGVYVEYVVAPEPPTMREGERRVDSRDPAQRNALAQAGASTPFLGAGVYLLYYSELPYLYPTVALALGLYLFSDGLHRYWRNTLTTYLLTNQRVLEEYRFISLVRNEVPLEKVRAVEERRSAWDSLFGLGNVAVRSGAAGELTVSIDEIYDSGIFADTIREQLGDNGDVGAEVEADPETEVEAGSSATATVAEGEGDSATESAGEVQVPPDPDVEATDGDDGADFDGDDGAGFDGEPRQAEEPTE